MGTFVQQIQHLESLSSSGKEIQDWIFCVPHKFRAVLRHHIILDKTD
jgi:hypothetical protein